MVDVIESLRRHFGHASFHPGQEALVRAVLDGRDVLAVMPTVLCFTITVTYFLVRPRCPAPSL